MMGSRSPYCEEELKWGEISSSAQHINGWPDRDNDAAFAKLVGLLVRIPITKLCWNSLICVFCYTVNGDDKQHVFWIHDGTVISVDRSFYPPRIHAKTDDVTYDVIIERATEADQGLYECQALPSGFRAITYLWVDGMWLSQFTDLLTFRKLMFAGDNHSRLFPVLYLTPFPFLLATSRAKKWRILSEGQHDSPLSSWIKCQPPSLFYHDYSMILVNIPVNIPNLCDFFHEKPKQHSVCTVDEHKSCTCVIDYIFRHWYGYCKSRRKMERRWTSVV